MTAMIRRLRGAARVAIAVAIIPSAATAGSLLEGRVIDRTLANGMRVLLVERPVVPTVSYNVTFRVGSVNEQTGESGLAHLFEHMAFKGTTTIGTKDYTRERPLLDEVDRLALDIQAEEDKGQATEGTPTAAT